MVVITIIIIINEYCYLFLLSTYLDTFNYHYIVK